MVQIEASWRLSSVTVEDRSHQTVVGWLHVSEEYTCVAEADFPKNPLSSPPRRVRSNLRSTALFLRDV
ncbi:hypothetical protein AHAS_Ahas14G0030800 [Arachis hypogaea]